MPSFFGDQTKQVKRDDSHQPTKEMSQIKELSEQSPLIFYQLTWQVSQNIKVNFISFHALTLLGFSAERIIENPTLVTERIYPEDLHILSEKLDNFRQFSNKQTLVFRYLTPAQSIKCLSTQVTPCVINEKTFLFEGTLQEKKELISSQVNSQLFNQDEYEIIDNLSYFVYVYDLSSKNYIYVNKGLSRIFEQDDNPGFSSRNWIQLVHPDDRFRLSSCYQQFFGLSDNDSVSIQYRIQDGEGQWKWLNSTLQIIKRSPDNVPLQIRGIAYDVTPDKKMKSVLRRQKGGEKLINAISRRIHQSIELDEILNVSVTEMRKFLQVDRVFIYQFKPDWRGVVAFESVASPWRSLLGTILVDQTFIEQYLPDYQQGRIQATDDIYHSGLSQCHIDWLANLQVRANLVLSILQGEELWGLLVAQHCRNSRSWQDWEIDCLKQLSLHIGIALEQEQLYRELQLSNEELQRLVFIDGLTSVANRRYFDERFDEEWRRMTREKRPLCLILCDVDFFKQYNDTYGHPAGDICLQQIAQIMEHSLKRSSDLVARYGGEEFAIILPHTDLVGGIHVAGEIRSRLRSLKLDHAGSGVGQQVTLSFGIASCLPTADITKESLLQQADQTLYQAKRQGRDRIAIAASFPQTPRP